MKTQEKPYPFFVVQDQKSGVVGQFKICREDAVGTLNPEYIQGKLLWYTTEGGYDYCHPFSRAQERANIIADALNKTKEQRKIESVASDLLEACLEAKRMYEELQPAGGWQGVYEQLVVAIKKAGGE